MSGVRSRIRSSEAAVRAARSRVAGSAIRLPPEVIDRSMPGAEWFRMFDGALQIGAGFMSGFHGVAAASEIGGDRGGERAAGPVRVARGDAAAAQRGELAPVPDEVVRTVAFEVA